MCFFMYRGHRLYASEQNLLQTYTNQQIPEIVCIGDSLTKGTGGEGVSYPNYLREILWDNSIYIPTTNLGVGGENSATIVCRGGADRFVLEEFIIPEYTVPVEIKFLSVDGKKDAPFTTGRSVMVK